MAVLDRSELQASPLSDLHAIADQLGLDGFRRLRKADLIDAILGEPSNGASADKSDESATDASAEQEDAPAGRARRRASTRRSRRSQAKDTDERAATDEDRPAAAEDSSAAEEDRPARPAKDRPRGGGRAAKAPKAADEDRSDSGKDHSAEGVVELLGNGSAFLRVRPPDASDEDVYISAAQVR